MSGQAPAQPQPQPTNMPTRKVAAGGIAGAVVAILLYVLQLTLKEKLPPIPPEVAAALTTIVAGAIAYIVPHGANEAVIVDQEGNTKAATT
jgi:hypothetical protein